MTLTALSHRAERLLLRLHYQLWQRKRHNRLVLEHAAGYDLLILPEVMNPHVFRSGELFADMLDGSLIAPHHRVLDMGAGSGVVAIAVARWAREVVAVDINPAAVRCTRINVLLNRLEDCVDVRQGDLFQPVHGETFDLVFFNPPYFRGAPQGGFDYAGRAEDTVERFVAQLERHLKPGGSALLVLSTDGDATSFLDTFVKHGYSRETVATRRLLAETLTVFRFRPKSSPPGKE